MAFDSVNMPVYFGWKSGTRLDNEVDCREATPAVRAAIEEALEPQGRYAKLKLSNQRGLVSKISQALDRDGFFLIRHLEELVRPGAVKKQERFVSQLARRFFLQKMGMWPTEDHYENFDEVIDPVDGDGDKPFFHMNSDSFEPPSAGLQIHYDLVPDYEQNGNHDYFFMLYSPGNMQNVQSGTGFVRFHDLVHAYHDLKKVSPNITFPELFQAVQKTSLAFTRWVEDSYTKVVPLDLNEEVAVACINNRGLNPCYFETDIPEHTIKELGVVHSAQQTFPTEEMAQDDVVKRLFQSTIRLLPAPDVEDEE